MFAWLNRWRHTPAGAQTNAAQNSRAASVAARAGERKPGTILQGAAHGLATASASDRPIPSDSLFATLTQQGQEALAAGDNELGLILFARAVQAGPERAAAHNNLGVALAANGQYADAVKSFEIAIERAPRQRAYVRNALLALVELRDHQSMAALLLTWQNTDPDASVPEAQRHFLEGICHQLRRAYPEAEAAYRQALARFEQIPHEFAVFLRLGYVLLCTGREEEAIALWQAGAERFPEQSAFPHNLAVVAWEAGLPAQSEAYLRQALALSPDSHEVKLALSMLLLRQGRFAEGWPYYEARQQTGFLAADLARFDPESRWQGDSLCGKTLIVWGEQGLGDQLQFVRYVPALWAFEPDEIIVICHASLIRLFSTVDREIRWISFQDEQPPYDVFVPMLSLPKLLGTTLDTIPAAAYLQAEAPAVAAWQARVMAACETPLPGTSEGAPAHARPLRVGLVWRGNPRRELSELNRMDDRRSVALADFADLWSLPQVRFFSLQKGEGGDELAAWPHDRRPLIDWTDELQDFADTAALVMALDLVISVDTSVVHLAAGLGKPVWVLSRLDGCWRWLEGRSDSPWYPSVRIFRQHAFGDWAEVMQELQRALSAEIGISPC